MSSDFVVIRKAYGLLRAQAIKAHLESRGIPVLLDYESAGPAIGITMDGLGEVRVKVPARLTRMARRLILTEGQRKMRRRWQRNLKVQRR
jgi:hypothetical protein